MSCLNKEIQQLKDSKIKTKKWIKNQQSWTWIITISWMVIANIWPPFGLYGFVCMFTRPFSGNNVMPSVAHTKRY